MEKDYAKGQVHGRGVELRGGECTGFCCDVSGWEQLHALTSALVALYNVVVIKGNIQSACQVLIANNMVLSRGTVAKSVVTR